MTFTDLLKTELVEATRYYKIDVDVNANKTALANALLDAGVTPEQWERDSNAEKGGAWNVDRPRLEDREDIGFDDEEEENISPPPPVLEEEEELVLVRFVGRNRSYTSRGRTFSANRPFALMSKEEYDKLDRKKFREATKSEAREFYG